jgi:hypothetical protein
MKIIGFFVVVLWIADQSPSSAQMQYKPDPWYSDPGNRSEALLSADKKAAGVSEVTESWQPVAQEALETAPFVPLTRSQAELYTGRASQNDKKYFLLARAVACNVQGGFKAFVTGPDLVGTDLGIIHVSIGGVSSVRRRAVVVALNVSPTALYSWCSSAR